MTLPWTLTCAHSVSMTQLVGNTQTIHRTGKSDILRRLTIRGSARAGSSLARGEWEIGKRDSCVAAYEAPPWTIEIARGANDNFARLGLQPLLATTVGIDACDFVIDGPALCVGREVVGAVKRQAT